MSDFTAAFFLEEDEDGEAALRLVLLEAEPMAPSTPARASTDSSIGDLGEDAAAGAVSSSFRARLTRLVSASIGMVVG